MTTRFGVEFHPSAADEVESAERWYRERSESTARRFRIELERAVEAIRESPSRWPAYLQGTRRFVLRRFPFLIVYTHSEHDVTVIAVAHARRRPGYWSAR